MCLIQLVELPVVRANYQATLGTTEPPLPRYYAGFNRKENRYVANLVNNSNASTGEILFGSEISGVKGFYVTGTLVNRFSYKFRWGKTIVFSNVRLRNKQWILKN